MHGILLYQLCCRLFEKDFEKPSPLCWECAPQTLLSFFLTPLDRRCLLSGPRYLLNPPIQECRAALLVMQILTKIIFSLKTRLLKTAALAYSAFSFSDQLDLNSHYSGCPLNLPTLTSKITCERHVPHRMFVSLWCFQHVGSLWFLCIFHPLSVFLLSVLCICQVISFPLLCCFLIYVLPPHSCLSPLAGADTAVGASSLIERTSHFPLSSNRVFISLLLEHSAVTLLLQDRD